MCGAQSQLSRIRFTPFQTFFVHSERLCSTPFALAAMLLDPAMDGQPVLRGLLFRNNYLLHSSLQHGHGCSWVSQEAIRCACIHCIACCDRFHSKIVQLVRSCSFSRFHDISHSHQHRSLEALGPLSVRCQASYYFQSVHKTHRIVTVCSTILSPLHSYIIYLRTEHNLSKTLCGSSGGGGGGGGCIYYSSL